MNKNFFTFQPLDQTRRHAMGCLPNRKPRDYDDSGGGEDDEDDENDEDDEDDEDGEDDGDDDETAGEN